MIRSVRLLAAAAVIGAVVAAPGVGRLDSSAATQPTSREGEARRSATVTVTLVTGDRVTLRGGGVVTITPGAGRENVTFGTYWLSGDLHVIPDDAGRLLAAGRVDERLFNVTQLVEWGYDDAHLDSVPVLVDRPTGQQRADVDGAAVQRSLASVGIDVASVDKSRAGRFGRT